MNLKKTHFLSFPWNGFRNSIRWPTYVINSVFKTKQSCNTPYWRSTLVSLENYPLYLYCVYLLLFVRQLTRAFRVPSRVLCDRRESWASFILRHYHLQVTNKPISCYHARFGRYLTVRLTHEISTNPISFNPFAVLFFIYGSLW